MKNEKVKKILPFILSFTLIIMGLICVMVLVAKIPKDKLKQNMEESANYLLEKPMYYNMVDNCYATKVDHYADAITLNIVYNLSPTQSVESVLYSKYYGNNGEEETKNFLKTVTDENCKADTQYIRYWHGEMIFLRVLLLIINIKQIYILNAIILLILVGILLYKLLKNKMYAVAVAIAIAMIVTNAFVVPFSLEYISMYFLMLISSIILVQLAEKKKFNKYGMLFFLTGMFTCYFDFLTVETITLTVPLVIAIIYKYKNDKIIDTKEIILYIIKLILVWAIGYVLMWITKWGIASIYLNENIKNVVFDNALQRIEKANVYVIGASSISNSVLLRNIHCLFPICFFYNKTAIIITFLFVLFTFLFFTRKDKNIKLSIILFSIGLIPYIRYLVINGHSTLHYFFTYRAQFVTVMVLIIGSYYMVDKQNLRRKKKCKKS